MIISDTEKFVFIHNPKVGGMTFRTALLQYDTRDNYFFEWKTITDTGKKLDMAHITPHQLRKFYPHVFREVRDYFKFGFVRNPYTRFLSGVSQHLKLSTPHIRAAMLNDQDLFYRFSSNFALTALKEEVIERDHRMVHFRRQSNFLFLDGAQWSTAWFRLETPQAIEGTPVGTWLGDAMQTPLNRTQELAATGYQIDRLSKDARLFLREFYKIDFENFGYDTFD